MAGLNDTQESEHAEWEKDAGSQTAPDCAGTRGMCFVARHSQHESTAARLASAAPGQNRRIRHENL